MRQPPPDREHVTPEHREDAIPDALATPLLQYLSTLALPPALGPDTLTPEAPRNGVPPHGDVRVPNTGALRTLVDQLLQDHAVLGGCP